MTAIDVVVGLAIAVGLAGIVVPVLPGTALIALALVVWAALTGGAGAWMVLAAALVVLAVGGVTKYVVPRRRLEDAGVPGSTQWAGAALGAVGFFVVPVVGLVLGFVLGVYLAEVRRLGSRAAWPSTRRALAAVGLGLLIELAAGLVASGLWVVGLVVT